MSTDAHPLGQGLTRFWCAPQCTVELDGHGYLADPEQAMLGMSMNPSLRATRHLAQDRCLLLLGEPGIGKSHVLREHTPLLSPTDTAEALTLDLAGYSEARLIAVLEGPEIQAWLAGTHDLCLTFDSFDEAHRRIQHLPALLLEYLNRWDAVDRLLLRIACRTAEWPTWVNPRLPPALGDAVTVELQPLRRRDIAALLPDDVSQAAFLDAVAHAQAQPLAARPLTGKLLAGVFRATGKLPERPADLYRQGLQALCDEHPGPRRDDPAFGPAGRLAIARRLAAISVFSGKPTFWTGPVAERPATSVVPDECGGPAEPANNTTVDLAPTALRDTLGTGLFTGRGRDALGWGHATFADFLAAEWIIAHGLNLRQTRSLLVASDGRVFPQVKQVAAWLVSMNPDAFGWLATGDPESFATNVDLPDDTLRASVVDGLFVLAGQELLRREFATHYAGLRHPHLGDQVAAHLSISAPPAVLRLAIDLADHCHLTDQVPALLTLVNDTGSPRNERVHAAWAISHLSRTAPTDALRPLIDDPASLGEDPDDELLGAVLLASWPHALTNQEALALARMPKRRNLHGGYAMFLNRLATSLTTQDLDAAIDWLRSHGGTVDEHHLSELGTAVIYLILENLDHPGGLDAIVDYARQRAQDYRPLYPDRYSRDAEHQPLSTRVRRRLAAALLSTGDQHIGYQIAEAGSTHGLSLITGDDLEWIIEQYAAAELVNRPPIADLFTWTYRITDPAHVHMALELPDDHPLVVDLIAAWMAPIPVDSPVAEAARRRWEMTHGAGNDDDPGDGPSVDELLATDLHAIAAGDLQPYPHALRLVAVPPGDQFYRKESQPDLTQHPRWNQLSDEARTQLIDTTTSYLGTGDPDPDRWLGRKLRLFAAEAGYIALILLLRHHPEDLAALEPAIWKKWAPIIVAWPTASNGATWEDKEVLLTYARPHAHNELADALLTLIHAAIDAGEEPYLDDEIDLLWNDDIAQELGARAADPSAPPITRRLLAILARHEPANVRSLLHGWLSGGPDDGDTIALALQLLLAYDAEPSWPLIRAQLAERPDLIADAFLSTAQTMSYVTPELTPDHLAELYVWLATRFPIEQDPDFDDVHFIGPRESLGHWRDALLTRLRTMGTADAVAAVATIAAGLPQYPWLRRTRADTADTFRAASWVPIGIPELTRLASERVTRLVRSYPELLDLTLQGLEATQEQLQGDTPDAPLLWDTHSRRPKSEDEISDYLRNHLQARIGERGIVVNREVQVRRPRPSGIGERTDLRLDATAHDPAAIPSVLTLAAEVKGAWHPQVHSAMRDQLLDRYMRDVGTRYGVYIVVWFNPADWTHEDKRRAAVAGTNIDQLRIRLEAQAAELAQEGFTVRFVLIDASISRPTAHEKAHPTPENATGSPRAVG